MQKTGGISQKIINTALLACIGLLLSFSSGGTFKSSQLKYARVKTAYKKWPALQALLSSKQVTSNDFDLYLRAFKQESELEVWAKGKTDTRYTLLKTFAVCAKSGGLGPKRRQGDGQVPEGFYRITHLNPASNYHLSLKVGYPNKSDVIKGGKDPGGDIMIHGSCVTIGCIPIEDGPIEELYVLCVEAKDRNRIIYADIYPCRFSAANQQQLEKNFPEPTRQFWASLKKAWMYFEKNHALPKVSINTTGDYTIEPAEL